MTQEIYDALAAQIEAGQVVYHGGRSASNREELDFIARVEGEFAPEDHSAAVLEAVHSELQRVHGDYLDLQTKYAEALDEVTAANNRAEKADADLKAAQEANDRFALQTNARVAELEKALAAAEKAAKAPKVEQPAADQPSEQPAGA